MPVLILSDGKVLEESLEIMTFALQQHDPDHWLPEQNNLQAVMDLIGENDGPF